MIYENASDTTKIDHHVFQVMDMYNNEEMEYELGPKTECYV